MKVIKSQKNKSGDKKIQLCELEKGKYGINIIDLNKAVSINKEELHSCIDWESAEDGYSDQIER